MPKYRKRKDKDAWHWCTNCTNYPTDNYDEETLSTGRPSSGELCNQCRSKESNGTCITS